jgi:lysyl-tRNA synthetase class 2
MAAKALRPLPVAHKEMNEETRVRQRYVDLIVRPAARDIARTRIAVVRAVGRPRSAADSSEVETPMLQTLAGGAAARPFVTHSNALDTDLYLRIAPELFLKRCVVGGFDKVFELNRNFRNEGADSTHSPEFSMLETYQAYGDYEDSARITREVIQEVADEAIGTRKCRCRTVRCTTSTANGRRYKCILSVSGPRRGDNPVDFGRTSVADCRPIELELPRDRGYGHGKLVELWEHTVGDH